MVRVNAKAFAVEPPAIYTNHQAIETLRGSI
jgi:hypothetical protein